MNTSSHNFTIGNIQYAISTNSIVSKYPSGETMDIPIFQDNVFANISTDICFISLHIIHDCIMNCEYCYGEGGQYGKTHPATMQFEVAVKAIDTAFQNIGDNQTLHINFFGGEPLLAFTLVTKIVDYSDKKAKRLSKKTSYSISTSGLIMTDEMISFLSEHHFSVSISIDGGKIHHDVHRKDKNGHGTYNSIIKNLNRLQEANVTVLDTATITHKTVNALRDIDSLLSLGITNFRFKVATGNIGEMAVNDKDIKIICSIYDDLCIKYLGDIKSHRFYDFGDFTKWIHRLNNGKYSYSNCTAGRNYYNIDPAGNIFLCHKFVSDNNNIIGHVSDGHFPTIEHHVDNTPCKSCWAKYICGGGCFFDGLANNNDFHNPSATLKCFIYKKQIEGAIMLYSELIKESLLKDFISSITSSHNAYQTIV